MSPLKLDVNIDAKEIQDNQFCANVLQILRKVREDWFKSDDPLKSLRAKVFTGGISNQLYGYYQDGKFQEDVVLLRIYGQGTELMVDRAQESKNIQVLSAAGRSPPLYANFNNGIAYGFANGCTLDVDSVKDPTIRKLIAKEMLLMHQIRPDNVEVKSGLWDKLYTFHKLIPDRFTDPERQKQYESTIKPKAVLKQELDSLKEHLEALNSPVVFCHNDLLLKNIIYNQEKGSITFIDHEYAMYNYEHFELGNHFDEYAGVDDVDFSRYPDKEYQIDWLRYYLQQKAILDGGSAEDVSDQDVEECYVKTNKFALAGHLFWGLWGLVQAKHSAIDFGFLDYARMKLDEYFARKDEFLRLSVQQ